MKEIAVSKRKARQRPRQSRAIPAPLRRWGLAELAPFGRTLADPLFLALLAIGTIALLGLLQVARPASIDVGTGRESFYLRDFFKQERVGDVTFRWTGAQSEVRLPAAAGNADWQIRLRLAGPRPEGAAPTVSVFADERLIGRFAVAPIFTDYTLDYRREALAPGDLTLRIASDTFNPPGGGDDRTLGVQVAEVTATPRRSDGLGLLLFPPTYLIAIWGAALLLAGSIRRLDGPRWLALVAAGAMLAGVFAGQVAAPGLAAYYLPQLCLAGLGLVVILPLLRLIMRRACALGGVAFGERDEQRLMAIVALGAIVHLAGVFYPGFRAHDIDFQTNRLSDVMAGRFLLTSLVDQQGVRSTPYPPALYILLAPGALLTHAPTLMLRFWPPIFQATSALLVFYLLRRRGVADPAPLLAAGCALIVATGSQLLWWAFYPNLFGQLMTLLVATIVLGHWEQLHDRRLFAGLTAALTVAFLSHPSAFVMLAACVPLLGAVLLVATRDRRATTALALAYALALGLAFLLFYRHFLAQSLDYGGALLGDDQSATDDAPGWELAYIRLRVFRLPLALYLVGAVAGIALLLRGRQRVLGWGLAAIAANAVLFAAVHVASGLWVRYFVFLHPALAIGTGVALAALWRAGRWPRLAALGGLAYGTGAALVLWLTITAGGGRSIYP